MPGATDLPDFPAGASSRVVGALAFSPDGKYLVGGFGIRWCASSGRFQGPFHRGQRRGVFARWAHPGVRRHRPHDRHLESRDAAAFNAVGSGRPRVWPHGCLYARIFLRRHAPVGRRSGGLLLLVRTSDCLERSRLINRVYKCLEPAGPIEPQSFLIGPIAKRRPVGHALIVDGGRTVV